MDESEYLPTIDRLRQRTEEGKISWKGTYVSDSYIFVVPGGKFSFQLSGVSDCVFLTMKDEDGKVLFSVDAAPPNINSDSQQERLFRSLAPLYEAAKKQVLQISEKLSDVNKILDGI